MDDDDEFRFNDASTHEGHLRQYGELTRFCSETIIMISHKLISGISNAQEFCRKNISVYAIFNGQSFNYMLTNNIISFEQLGPVVQSVVSLTSLLRVISLTVLADSIYNILIFFAEKM